MTKEEIKKEVLKYRWGYWSARPYKAFVSSLFRGVGRKYFKKIGMDAEWPAMLYQAGNWYKSWQVWDEFGEQLEENIKKGFTAFKIVALCEEFYVNEKTHIIELLNNQNRDPMEKLAELKEIYFDLFPYIWLAHGLEHVYLKKLHSVVNENYKGDAEKFIGDITYPAKKNKHVLFTEALASDLPIADVHRNYAWVKCRDGFSPGFTISELEEERIKIKNRPKPESFIRPEVPEYLRELTATAQEIVYFRTMRTDVLYEFLFICRPILEKVAAHFGIPFAELANCDILDLLDGLVKQYPSNFTMAAIGGNLALFPGAILDEKIDQSINELKGVVAFKGKVRGTVKVIIDVPEMNKVNEGDILVAPTTAPSFIFGMKKAAAFVTDEGGITSHTAIVAREMQKPCIIGTKIATKVLKDGDVVEVNADEGTVKILKKAKLE